MRGQALVFYYVCKLAALVGVVMALLSLWCGEYFGMRNILVWGEVSVQELILSQELWLMERTHTGMGLSEGLQPREKACAGAGRSVRRNKCQRECYELMTVFLPHYFTLFQWEEVEPEMKG